MSTENDQPETDTIEFDVDATTTDGIVVPISIVVEFPKNYGLYAVKVLEKIHEDTAMFYRQLVHQQDMSVMTALAELNDSDE